MAFAEPPRRHRLGAALLGASLGLSAANASAFCRTTTCDPRREHCAKRADGCITQGAALVWPDRCVSFGTQEDASPKRRISYVMADRIFKRVFQTWASVDCGGGQPPSFQVWDMGDAYGGIVCAEPEFNRTLPNANVWMFRDDDWPYESAESTLAMTTVQFERSSGVILDADVEVNSFKHLQANGKDGQVAEDLASIATHEAGHFLGLSHTRVDSATMYPQYSPGIRSLHTDDMKGICEAYPPDRKTPTCTMPRPPHGFSRYCGGGDDEEPPAKACTNSVASAGTPEFPAGGGLALAGVLGLAAGRLLARRKRSR